MSELIGWLPVYGMFILLLLGAPVYLALGAPSLAYLLLEGIPPEIFPQRLSGAIDNSILLAIPMFLLSGRLMNRIGATERIFDFAFALIGSIRGGIGHVSVVASLLFSAMSGSSTADSVGVGTMTVKAARMRGYPAEFAAAITLISSCLAPIIPPSIVMIIYGSASGVSIGRMFIGGVVPGLILAFALMCAVSLISARRQFPVGEPLSVRRIGQTFKRAIFVLFTPVIIIGGIFTGFFTPTEASVAAVTYVILVGLAYRALTLKILWEEIAQTGTLVGVLMFVVAISGLNSWVFALEQIPSLLVQALNPDVIRPEFLVIGILAVVMLLGTFMDGLPIILMLVPVVGPLIARAQIDPVHFGVLFCVMCVVGTVTPPVGGALYGVSMVSNLKPETVFFNSLPFFFSLLAVVLVLVFYPNLILWLPGQLM